MKQFKTLERKSFIQGFGPVELTSVPWCAGWGWCWSPWPASSWLVSGLSLPWGILYHRQASTHIRLVSICILIPIRICFYKFIYRPISIFFPECISNRNQYPITGIYTDLISFFWIPYCYIFIILKPITIIVICWTLLDCHNLMELQPNI